MTTGARMSRHDITQVSEPHGQEQVVGLFLVARTTATESVPAEAVRSCR
jgi:hypothetical protein